MPKWEEQILEILSRKQQEELEEFKVKLWQAGRLAPCLYISLEFKGTLTAICKRGKELNCLICSEYRPEETPGHWSKGYAQFESSKIIHLMEHVESDGYWRSGFTLCRRWLSEENDNVEIYPLNSFAELLKEFGDYALKHVICKKCNRIYRDHVNLRFK